MYTITIDCGTSFLKAALVEYETGKIIKKITKRTSEIETKNRFPRIQGVAYAVKEILREFQCFGDKFYVGISTEMHGFVLTDMEGNILCDYVSWKDEWALEKSERGSYLEEIASLVNMKDIESTGMPLKAGIASTNLYVVLDKNPGLKGRKARFYTLGDYLIYSLTSIIPAVHPTNAAASGLYDLGRKKWNERLIEQLGYQFIQFPSVDEDKIVEAQINGCRYCFCEAIGDQQAALLGSGMKENVLSFNLGTGSQVSILDGNLIFDKTFQTRPFFNNMYLNTIPHVPCGRALNVYINFFRELLKAYNGMEVEDEKLWKIVMELAATSDDTELIIDMSFFPNSVNKNTNGKIANILETNFTVGNLMRSVFEQMAENYYVTAKRLLKEKHKVDKVIFSGGVANKNLLLREKIIERFPKCEVEVSDQETFRGLWMYVKEVNDGRL